jgi:hypothetical protein
MKVYLDKVSGKFIAYVKKFGMFGIGNTREEAIANVLKYVWQ